MSVQGRVLPPERMVEDPYSARFHPCQSGRNPGDALSPGAADGPPFPERHSPAWWVLSQLNGAHAWDSAPTRDQLRNALSGHAYSYDVDLAMADLIVEGRIRSVVIDHGDGTGWALTERGMAEWREHRS